MLEWTGKMAKLKNRRVGLATSTDLSGDKRFLIKVKRLVDGKEARGISITRRGRVQDVEISLSDEAMYTLVNLYLNDLRREALQQSTQEREG